MVPVGMRVGNATLVGRGNPVVAAGVGVIFVVDVGVGRVLATVGDTQTSRSGHTDPFRLVQIPGAYEQPGGGVGLAFATHVPY